MIFSDSQKQAVMHAGGPALVLAGPGSGKTAVITARLDSLVNSLGIKEDNILVVTFTKAAAMEMRLRAKACFCGRDLNVSFGTFHSVFFTILQHTFDLSRENILTAQDKYNFIREALENTVITGGTEAEFIGDVSAEISIVKNSNIDPADYEPKNMSKADFMKVFDHYGKKLKACRLYDFDDMLLETYRLFIARPDVLEAWRGKFKYIMVDEAQDMNELQYAVIKLLAGESCNLFMVGDDDQSIYGFRGARPGILSRFSKEVGNVRIYRLGENFRSYEEIVKAAEIVIGDNRDRFEKNVKAVRGRGGNVEIVIYDGIYKQNADIIKKILALKAAGLNYDDMAVLYRTNRQSALLARMLMAKGIPFYSKERISDIFDNREICDILAYLKLSAGEKNRGDFLCIMNKPVRYISREMLTEGIVNKEVLLERAKGRESLKTEIRSLFDCFDTISRLSPFAAVNFIRKGVGYEDHIREECRKSGADFDEKLKNMDWLSDLSKEYKNINDFLCGIERLRTDRRESERGAGSRGVFLSTYHGAKGLEYKAVFLPESVNSVIPYKKAVLPSETEEERRLFYVAMTRAKDVLYIYTDNDPSPFLEKFLKETNPRHRPLHP